MIRSDWVLNLVVVLAILWRLPVSDWAQKMPYFQYWAQKMPYLQFHSANSTTTNSSRTGAAAEDKSKGRAAGAVFGALLGDALALQTHYEYDYKKIRDFYRITLNGTVEKLAAELRANAAVLGIAVTPGFEGADMKNWHPGKKGGDLTDYGDCVVMALEFLAKNTWSLAKFEKYWWDWIEAYQGYINMATKQIIMRKQKNRQGPGRLGWPPSEDLFAACRVPALLFAFRDPYENSQLEACKWSSEVTSVREPYPGQLASPFMPPDSEKIARQHCEHLGIDLCGGITCWVMKNQEPTSRACVMSLPGAREIPNEQDGTAMSLVLQECNASNPAHGLSRRVMEAASLQYATDNSFLTVTFLAKLSYELTQGKASTRAELQSLMRDVAATLSPHWRKKMRAMLDAIDQKLSDVEQDGSTWSQDPVEVDDLAIKTFAYTSEELVAYIPYPCRESECDYWQDHGKASPTIPALVAALYLYLRYVDSPFEHVLGVNAMIGGDTSARGVVLGMLVGATQGYSKLPQRLLRQLRVAGHVSELLRSF